LDSGHKRKRTQGPSSGPGAYGGNEEEWGPLKKLGKGEKDGGGASKSAQLPLQASISGWPVSLGPVRGDFATRKTEKTGTAGVPSGNAKKGKR